MHPEPLIQKLFAIERAIGNAQPAQLRAMVVDAQEAALRMDLDNLHSIDEFGRQMNAAGNAGSPGLEPSSLRRTA